MKNYSVKIGGCCSLLELVFNESLDGTFLGSLGLIDYDEDGDLDVMQMGEGEEGGSYPKYTRIIKNS